MEASTPLLTTDEVAAYLKVDVVTVRRLVTRRELAAYRIGNEYRFTNTDLFDYLQRQHMPASPLLDQPIRNVLQQILQPFANLFPGKNAQAPGSHFTKRAKQVLHYATEEARTNNRSAMSTDLFLISLLREESGMAARVLRDHGVTLERVRAVDLPLQEWPEATTHAPGSEQYELTQQCKDVLSAAISQAADWKHEYIGTEHILYGLTTVQASNALLVLDQLAVPVAPIQETLVSMIAKRGA